MYDDVVIKHDPGHQSWRDPTFIRTAHGAFPRLSEQGLRYHGPKRRKRGGPVAPNEYVNHLRTLGQELENLGINRFNLECREDDYLVWVPGAGSAVENIASAPKVNLWLKLWRGTARLLAGLLLRRRRRCYRYSLADIGRIERLARDRRGQELRAADGHSLSQLLRTIGALADQKSERLLGISWQNNTVSIVAATAQG